MDINKASHSNNYLEIISLNHKSCVQKVFLGDLSRAKLCVDKQRNFQKFKADQIEISSALVLDFNAIDDDPKLIMPYIEGINGEFFAIYCDRLTALSLNSSLSTFICNELAASNIEKIKKEVLLSKANSVLKAVADSDLGLLVNEAIRSLHNLSDTLNIPIGNCHGDLTLSNMILKSPGELVLIDFLDTYLETPLQDVVKLEQDFKYGWSFRGLSSQQQLKGEIFLKYAFPKAINFIRQKFPNEIFALTILGLIRIAPYVKDELTKIWLINSINRCIAEGP